MIKIEGIKKYYGDRLVLDIPKLELKKGNIYSILGKNGAGKSTLFKILSGLLEKDDGEIEIDETDTIFSMQDTQFFKGNVIFNLIEPFKLREENPPIEKIEKLLKRLNIEKLKNEDISTLSGGEKSKVQFIRTVIHNKNYMFFDEPTASVDKEYTEEIEKILIELKKDGKCVVLITHDFRQATKVSNFLLEIDKGKIIKREERNV